MTAEQFFDAIERGDVDAVALALSEDRSLLESRNARDESPVLAACYRRQDQVLKLLLLSAPRLSMFEAAAAGQVEQLVAHLKSRPATINSRSSDGWTALHLAAFFGRQAAVAELLRRGANFEAWSDNVLNNQPLHAAAAGGHVEVCRMLIEAGADVNTRQHGGYSPLHSAAHEGNEALVELLLDAGADRSSPTVAGELPADLEERQGRLRSPVVPGPRRSLLTDSKPSLAPFDGERIMVRGFDPQPSHEPTPEPVPDDVGVNSGSR